MQTSPTRAGRKNTPPAEPPQSKTTRTRGLPARGSPAWLRIRRDILAADGQAKGRPGKRRFIRFWASGELLRLVRACAAHFDVAMAVFIRAAVQLKLEAVVAQLRLARAGEGRAA